jgi:hypothetical protein
MTIRDRNSYGEEDEWFAPNTPPLTGCWGRCLSGRTRCGHELGRTDIGEWAVGLGVRAAVTEIEARAADRSKGGA